MTNPFTAKATSKPSSSKTSRTKKANRSNSRTSKKSSSIGSTKTKKKLNPFGSVSLSTEGLSPSESQKNSMPGFSDGPPGCRVPSGHPPGRFSWIGIGMRVRVLWEIDPRSGNGPGEFIGEVKGIDSWLWAVDGRGVHLHMPFSLIDEIDEINEY